MNRGKYFSSIGFKIVFILSCLIFISQVYSFSSASIYNEAKVSFLSSENSLIAMPEEIILEAGYNLENLFADEGQDIPDYTMEIIDSNFIIKNNTEYIITLDCYINPPNYGVFIENNQNIKTVFPGESYKVDFLLDNNIFIGKNRYTALIYANWDNGSAKLEKDFVINVEPYPEVFIDTSNIKEIVDDEGISNPQELIFEKPQSEYDNDSAVSNGNDTGTSEKQSSEIIDSHSQEGSGQIIENESLNKPDEK